MAVGQLVRHPRAARRGLPDGAVLDPVPEAEVVDVADAVLLAEYVVEQGDLGELLHPEHHLLGRDSVPHRVAQGPVLRRRVNPLVDRLRQRLRGAQRPVGCGLLEVPVLAFAPAALPRAVELGAVPVAVGVQQHAVDLLPVRGEELVGRRVGLGALFRLAHDLPARVVHRAPLAVGRDLLAAPRHPRRVGGPVHGAVDADRHVDVAVQVAGEVVVEQRSGGEGGAGLGAVHGGLERDRFADRPPLHGAAGGALLALERLGLPGEIPPRYVVDQGPRAGAEDLGAEGVRAGVEVDVAEALLLRGVRLAVDPAGHAVEHHALLGDAAGGGVGDRGTADDPGRGGGGEQRGQHQAGRTPARGSRGNGHGTDSLKLKAREDASVACARTRRPGVPGGGSGRPHLRPSFSLAGLVSMPSSE